MPLLLSSVYSTERRGSWGSRGRGEEMHTDRIISAKAGIRTGAKHSTQRQLDKKTTTTLPLNRRTQADSPSALPPSPSSRSPPSPPRPSRPSPSPSPPQGACSVAAPVSPREAAPPPLAVPPSSAKEMWECTALPPAQRQLLPLSETRQVGRKKERTKRLQRGVPASRRSQPVLHLLHELEELVPSTLLERQPQNMRALLPSPPPHTGISFSCLSAKKE